MAKENVKSDEEILELIMKIMSSPDFPDSEKKSIDEMIDALRNNKQSIKSFVTRAILDRDNFVIHLQNGLELYPDNASILEFRNNMMVEILNEKIDIIASQVENGKTFIDMSNFIKDRINEDTSSLDSFIARMVISQEYIHTHLEDAFRIYPDDNILLDIQEKVNSGEFNAEELISILYQRYKDNRLIEKLEQNKTVTESGNIEGIMDTMIESISDKPDSFLSHVTHAMLGGQDADHHIDQALSIETDIPAEMSMKALLLEDRFRYDEAIMLYEKLLSKERTDEILLKIANAYIAMQKYNEAEAYIDECIGINSNNIEANIQKYYILESRDSNTALKYLENLSMNNPDNIEYHNKLMTHFAINKDMDNASHHAREILAIDFDNIDANLFIIQLASLQDKSEAINDCRIFLNRVPRNATVHASFALLLLADEETRSQALIHILFAHRLDPHDKILVGMRETIPIVSMILEKRDEMKDVIDESWDEFIGNY